MTAVMFVGETSVNLRGDSLRLLNESIRKAGFLLSQTCTRTIVRAPEFAAERNPSTEEVALSMPELLREIAKIKPRVIVTLGRPASNALLGTDAPITAMRGRFHDRNGIKVMPTFHPAYLLREPSRQSEFISDLQVVRGLVSRRALVSSPEDAESAWSLVLEELEERRRFSLLGPFQHARVMKWNADEIELGFPVDVHSMGELANDKDNIRDLLAIVREMSAGTPGNELCRVQIRIKFLDLKIVGFKVVAIHDNKTETVVASGRVTDGHTTSHFTVGNQTRGIWITEPLTEPSDAALREACSVLFDAEELGPDGLPFPKNVADEWSLPADLNKADVEEWWNKGTIRGEKPKPPTGAPF